jgi:hypothetical protein
MGSYAGEMRSCVTVVGGTFGDALQIFTFDGKGCSNWSLFESKVLKSNIPVTKVAKSGF